jgi:amino acid adenylation domain-containing protein
MNEQGMDAQGLMHLLHGWNVRLTVVDGKLRCRARKGLLTPELLAQLDRHKVELLGLLQAHGNAGAIPRRPAAGTVPLSFAQQRLWFLAQLDPRAAAAYALFQGVRFKGELDVVALRAALDRIVARHEALRTSFTWAGDEPAQVIAASEVSFALAHEDLWDHPAPEAEVERLAAEEMNGPFDLERGPLIRGRLVRLAPHDHVLLVTMHHIVSDGWSMGVLVNEFSALYAAFSQGRPDPLPPLPIQYADYAVWQRRWITGEVLQRQLDFWRAHLSGAPALLELPTDRPRPPVQDYAGASFGFELDAELSASLKALSQRHGTTLFMTLLAAWAALLARLSGQHDVVIGTPVANRHHAQIEPLIGFFVNTQALRIDLSGSPTVAQLLAQVRATALAAQEHQDLPFEQVVEALSPERRLAHSPIFQVMFSWQNAPEGSLELPGLQLQPVNADVPTVQFDLDLSLQAAGHRIAGHIGYACALFDRATVERHIAHWQTLLRALVADDQAIVTRLPLLSGDEQRQLVHGFNDTAASLPTGLCVHALFEAQVERTPEATALVFEDISFSYGELNAQANRLAHHLIALGVQPDTRIAIALPRGIDMVVAILATLKAGGAYVPLDPNYPAERLAFMLQDCRPAVLLSDAASARRLPAREGMPVVRLDDGQARWRDQPAGNPGVETIGLNAQHLAYVIYTSGSTGTPKGVQVAHASLVNYALAAAATYGLKGADRVLQSSSISFDIAVDEIFATLACGATLVLAPWPRLPSIAEFNALIARRDLTVVNLPTAYWHEWVAATQADAAPLPESLRLVVVGGEAASAAHLRQWRSVAGKRVAWINCYGPTETTAGVTFGRVGADEPMHIGSPIANTRLYVLDAWGQLVPMGVFGEIHIGGVQVARGYLNRPDITAERFVPDPFCEPGSRMYKTGDLARWRPDGTMEFLGRHDEQVKVRGFRIELGEIESALRSHPEVREAVVLVREDAPGDKRLVAYVIGEAAPEALRAHLGSRLPEYMVPAAYVALEALPLAPNGKLERRALPAPKADAFGARTHEAPQGEVETLLAQLWSELLGIERVGRHDDFFRLGGHSLLAVRLMERLRQHGLQLEVRTLFTSPTLAALSAAAQATAAAAVPPNLIDPNCTRITPQLLPLLTLSQDEIDAAIATVSGGVANVQDIYPLAPLQHGILFHHLAQSAGDTYLQLHLLAFDARDRMDRFLGALQAVIDRHDILRTAFVWQGLSQPVQVVWRRASLPIEEIALDGPDVATQLRERFDPRCTRLALTQAPLLRAHVAHDTEHNRWLLCLLQHHLVGDHTTMELLIEEVQAHLASQQHRLPAPLPFRTFIAQSQQGPIPEQHEAFFKEMLGDIDEPTAPFGVLDVQGDGFAIDEAHLPLDAPLARQLRQHARRLGVSTASLFHLAWALVLARTTGRDDVVFASVLFGRLQGTEGAHRMLGMFLNTLPIRLDIDRRGVEAAVRDTHKRLAQLLHHEHAPLALAQRASGVAAPTPLFTSLLNYRHQGGSAVLDHDAAAHEQAWAGMDVLHAQEQTNYPIALSVNDEGEGFSLDAQADPRIDAQRLGGYMLQALHALGLALQHDPAAELRTLDVLPEPERQHLVHAINDTAAPFPREQCIHQLLEEQAARTPEGTALVFEDTSLSYAELNAQANRLAHHLMALGVGPDSRVAVALPRGIDLVVTLLATLKAGGAYVPLDPDYPAERLAYMLSDSAPRVLVTDARGRAALGDVPPSLAVLALDAATRPWESLPAVNPDLHARSLTSAHLAYVIYTSGSTGLPKGVMVEHAQVVRLFEATRAWFDFGAQDVWTLFHSYAFDFSVWELWGALLHGGRLVVVPHLTARSPREFYELLCDQHVTVLNQTPSAFRQLVAAQADSDRMHHLRCVIFGGEALAPSTLSPWYARNGESTRLVNMYGITETTVHVTYRPLTPEDTQCSGSPIGVRIPDLRVMLLDAHGQPVPIGVPGELCVGGAGVARGYLGRPDLTAERFVPDPFGKPGSRMYKSGDLGRRRPDDSIEYLGRNDHQVKVRGFRIELGEIEAALRSHPEVRDAVVLAREDAPGEQRLVAYVVGEVAPEVLRQHLGSQLPEYMVPAAYVALQALPLTANGKLDRRALPAPEADAYSQRAYEAAQGELEATLAAIWRALLGLERIGRHDDFFALGGHSLLAVQLTSRIRTALGLDVPLAELFAQPTLAGFAQRVAASTASALPAIVPASRQEALPLSFAQQRLWFLAQLDERAAAAYAIPGGVRMKGPLDVAALHAALNRIVERHEPLRTYFGSVDGAPVQLIASPDVGLALTQVDLSGHSDAEAELERLAGEEARAPFDLTRGPLVRGRLIRLADDDHALLVTMHHIVSDGWSMGVLINEFSALYAAYAQGRSDPLPALPIQYADYAVWQRRWITGEVLQRQLGFWRAHLSGAPALLDLPTDRPRPAVQDYAGASLDFELDAQLTANLKALSQRHGTTLFMTLLASWAALLARLSGQSHVVIGTPVANRHRAEIEPLIGFFVNTQALRVDLSGSPSVTELLAQVRSTALAAQAHQDIPFEQLVEALSPSRSMAHSPIFQVLFAWQNAPEGSLDLPGLQLEPVGTPSTTVRFDLELSLHAAGERIAGSVGYACALFERSSVELHLGHWQTLLRGLVADDSARVARLPLLTPHEHQRLLHAFNNTVAPYPHEHSIHQLFEEQATRTPEATALVFEGTSFTYRDLNAQANRLAHHLMALGVRAGDCVALALPRSHELVAAELAVLKCGAAYVPLDLEHPSERLHFMLSDCAARVLVCHSHCSLLGPTRLELDLLADPGVDTNPQRPVHPQASAYVMYTSGSTGTPKGVVVPHRAVVHFACNGGHADIRASDRVAFLANPAFDASTFDVWAALLHGAALVVIDTETLLQPHALAQRLGEVGVSVLHLTAGLLPTYGPVLAPALASLRCLLTGGDRVDVAAVAHILEHSAPQRLLHCYGPTETTTFALTHAVSLTDAHGGSLPLGRPIDRVRVYVLDPHGAPVPVGVAGEIHIGGDGVAQGYLRRPDLTAERFVPNPFGEPGSRMYKTGDLGRWRADGTIEFLGRNDHQVKIRGFRIELGEIEAALKTYPQVREAIVLARQDRAGDQYLVAYVTSRDTVERAALRAHLTLRLPDYMVPVHFVLLDGLPLTPNGKLDRAALPAPEGVAGGSEYMAPRTAMEERLARIWAEVLGLERVGVQDDFFALGGHSLRTMEVLSRIRSICHVDLPLRALFEATTVEQLARYVEAAQPATTKVLHIERVEPQPDYEVTSAQRRLWLLHRLDARSTAYHVPALLDLPDIDCATLEQALGAVLRRHEVLRTVFVEGEDGMPRQQVREPWDVKLNVHRFEPGQPLEAHFDRFISEPFDLSSGPLFRVEVWRTAGQGVKLAWCLHEIVADGSSSLILEREVSELLRAQASGEAPRLPALPIQYKDYAAWQNRLLREEDESRQYWHAQLDAGMGRLQLPYDWPVSEETPAAAAQYQVAITGPVHEALMALCRRHQVTVFMLLHASLSVWLARLTGQRDIVIAVPSAGRDASEVEPLIGFFLNTVLLRLQLQAGQSFEQVLAHARDVVLNGLQHQHYPFEQLIEELDLPRPANQFPVTPVLFNLLSFLEREPIGNVPAEHVVRKLDAKTELELTAQEHADGLVLCCTYRTGLFKPQTIEYLIQQWLALLQQVSTAPGEPVEALAVFVDERVRTLQSPYLQFANELPPAPPIESVLARIARRAKEAPEAVAIEWRDRQCTYVQLEAHSDRIARQLLDMGCARGDVVAVLLRDPMEHIAAVIGTMKAGAVFVTLDAADPPARLQRLAGRVQPNWWIAEHNTANALHELASQLGAAPRGVALGEVEVPGLAPLAPKLASLELPTEADACYIFFTSGSTGQPKPILGRSQSLAQFIEWEIEAFHLDRRCRVSQLTASTFDAFLRDVFVPLCAGGTVCVPPQPKLAPDELLQWLEGSRVTHVHCVPSLLRAVLAQAQQQEALPSLRALQRVCLSGEPVLPATVQAWHAAFGDRVELVNFYGASETTMIRCWHRITADDVARGFIPIGRPITHTQAIVLDEQGHPCAPGVPGEIWLRSRFFTLGYYGDEARTAEVFVRNPLRPQDGERVYRSGDLGLQLDDGTLRCLGRRDGQVKVNGVRIEVGEVENVLLGHPQVSEAAVVVQQGADGATRISAYVVARADADELMRHLAQCLPGTMLPSRISVLETLPLTSTGKIDRKALGALEDSAVQEQAPYMAPSTETERTVAELYGQVLGRERVGCDDDFFALGGHSLQALMVIARIRKAVGVELALRVLFEERTVRRVAQKIDATTEDELAALPILRRPPDLALLPLSFAQQRLWFLAQLDERASGAYAIPGGVRLKGSLDTAALHAALNRIVARHEALRTYFGSVDGAPVQLIASADVGMTLTQMDLSGNSDAEAELERLAGEEARAPFDLTRGPLIRGRLIRLADDDHALLVTMHHIVSDGWSMGVLVNEFSALYTAFSDGRPDPLAPLAIQYADYAVWQRRWITGEVLQRQLDFWRDHLSGAPVLLELPTDRPRPAVQDYAGASFGFEIDADLSANLKALSQRHHATLFMTLLASWAALLARLSGQSDVVIGTPVANRHRAEIEPLIGCFVNTQALRIDLSGSPTVAQLLAQVLATALVAQEHQDVPFEQVVEALSPTRSMAHSPVFQVLFAWQNAPEGSLELPGLQLQPVGASSATVKFDLELTLHEAGDRIAGSVGYACALFDRSSIERHLRHWQTLLRSMVADDAALVARLPLLTVPEQQHLLLAFNDTAVPFPDELCIHQLFEAQAGRTPEATALVFEETSLSYAQLNSQANRLAHHLIALGIAPDTRVAIALPRGIHMVVALLATLKAGGAYVPLDPEYPAERLAFMLADSAPRVLLTESGVLGALGDLAPCLAVLQLDADHSWQSLPAANPDPASLGLTPQHQAYVIYTSGSTGTPKGVMIEHRNAVNFVHWGVNSCTPAVLQRTLWSTSMNFDLAVFECFVPLSCGAAVHLVSDALALARRQEDVTLLNTVPSAMAALLDAQAVPASVRQVHLAGEPLQPQLVQRIFAHTEADTVCNLYGPTETTTYSTWIAMSREAGFKASIGRPIANTRIYILDTQGQSVPIGVVGEIHIGGAGVARGYLNRPDLTLDRFVPDPFGEPGSRMYKTGDLGRWRADGTVEFLGRSDHQIKIRGFRIELGEIESVLRTHPEVREAVVLAREDAPGDKRLVAYVVGEQVQPEALRMHVAAKLPEYMVPAAYVRIDVLPLTPNGKLDRNALPAPESDSLAQPIYTPPQTETERALAAIWSELLALPIQSIGRDSDFFAMGGHSLLAVRVASHVQQALQRTLPLREIFAHRTLRELASHLDALVPTANLPVIEPVPRDAPLPLAPVQERLWVVHQMPGLQTGYNMAMALQLQGPLSVPALQAAFDILLQRHETLRTRFVADAGGQPRQVIEPTLSLHIPVRQARRDEVPALAAEHASQVFDLGRAPLLNVQVLRLDEQEHVLLLNMHHIISDGWSMNVLAHDMQRLYAAQLSGMPAQLPMLGVQYADHAHWLRQQDMAAHAAYWAQTLHGYEPGLTLPLDRPAQPRPSPARTLTLDYPADLASSLTGLCTQHGTTLFMALTAALGVVLQRYTGRDDLCVGTTVAGRDRVELEPLIGFFINIVALRLDLSREPTGTELLQRVKDTALQAFEHQALPFEQVLQHLKLSGDSAQELVPVMVRHQNMPDSAGSQWSDELTVEILPGSEQSAVCPLDVQFFGDGQGLCATVQYAGGLFDEATVRRLLQHHQQVLRHMVQQPQQPLSSLPLLTADERQLIEHCNRTARELDHTLSVATLFEQQAQAAPEACACIDEQGQLSYAELNVRANRIAHALRERGVGPEVRVGLYMPRSCDFIAAMLGIFKAGGVYMPLDTNAPPAFLQKLIDDAQPRVLMHGVHLPEAACAGIELLDVAHAASEGAQENLSVPWHAQQLAMLAYTSGSTGQPKGVLVPHGQLLNLLRSMQARLPLQRDDVIAQKTMAPFVVSMKELWGALLAGVPQVIVGDTLLKDPPRFIAALQRGRVTRLFIVPAHLQAVLDALNDPEALSSLRVCVTAGEPLSQRLRERVQRALPWVALWNNFGCTELNDTTYCDPEHLGGAGQFVPIGGPIDNVQVHVLDQRLRELPLGVVGELCVEYPWMARGYWRQPELTAERFVPNPYGPPGSRLYRTGDMVRRLADGALEYLGREDFDIKIRGQRVDVRQVEAALTGCEGVHLAAAAGWHDDRGDTRLVAYVVPRAGQPLQAATLRRQLTAQLPAFMVPSLYVAVEALPRTTTGKLDRKSLPAPQAGTLAQQPYVAPQTDTERALAGLWSRFLELPVDTIGREDDFFALGGHSLLATRVAAHVQEVLHCPLQLEHVFAHATLRDLAAHIDAAVAGLAPPRVSKDSAGSWLIRLPCSMPRMQLLCFHHAGGNASGFLPWKAHLSPDIELCAVQLPGRGARVAEPPVREFEALVDELVEVIRQHVRHPFAFFGHSMGGLIAFEVARRCQRLGLPLPLHLFVSASSAPASRGASMRLHELDNASLIEALHGYDGTSPEVLAHRELMETMLRIVRADFAMLDQYRYEPGPPLPVPITVLAGAEDELVPHESLDRWQECTQLPCRRHEFDGGHFYLQSQTESVIALINGTLSAAQPF